MQRTIRIELQPTHEQANALRETRRQFTHVFNAVAAYGWQERIKNGVTLHHALYYSLKAQYPEPCFGFAHSSAGESHRSGCECLATCQRP